MNELVPWITKFSEAKTCSSRSDHELVVSADSSKQTRSKGTRLVMITCWSSCGGRGSGWYAGEKRHAFAVYLYCNLFLLWLSLTECPSNAFVLSTKRNENCKYCKSNFIKDDKPHCKQNNSKLKEKNSNKKWKMNFYSNSRCKRQTEIRTIILIFFPEHTVDFSLYNYD